MLCGTDYLFGPGINSQTKYNYRHAVICGDNAFELIDTPGADSREDSYKHAYLLKTALTSFPLNTIFIVIKYESRYEKLLQTYEELSEIFYKYDHKIVVMISHWDMAKYPAREYPTICKVFEDVCPYIICYSEKSNKEDLANLMYLCISNIKPEKLEIPDEHFFLKYPILQIKQDLRKQYGEYKTQRLKLKKDFEDAVHAAYDDVDRNDVLFYMVVQFKYELQMLLEDFQKEYGNQMIEIDFFTFHIQMHNENLSLIDEFSQKIGKIMNYCPFDSTDPRNLIKQCPYCGIIWFKVEGCDGQTTCGNKVESPFDLLTKHFRRIRFLRVDGRISWTKSLLNEIVAKVRSFVPKTRIFYHQGAGCGKSIIWKDLPPLKDELILELFKVGSIEEVKKLIKDMDFQNVRKNYEKTIDILFRN
jgi:hypothetical protein